MNIIKAGHEYLDICAKILKGSELGMKYFINRKGEYIGKQLLEEGFDNNEIHVALTEDGICVGFAWIQLRGAFHWFPFLHVLAVEETKRGKGIGSQLMKYYEHISFVEDRSPKAFLMVGDYNSGAFELYKRLGYVEVGRVPDLYLNGVSEILMMKNREASII